MCLFYWSGGTLLLLSRPSDRMELEINYGTFLGQKYAIMQRKIVWKIMQIIQLLTCLNLFHQE